MFDYDISWKLGKLVSNFEEFNKKFDIVNNTISKIAKAMDVNEENKIWCQKVYFELTKLDGVDEDFVFEAYDFLVSNPAIAHGFLGIPDHTRLCWLVWKMRKVHPMIKQEL